MDAKLKALKVVDLRNILATARVQVPAKATKNDLIAKILASNAALDTYAALYPPDDLLAPPEEVDWNEDQIDTPPPQQQQQQQQQKVAPAPAPAPEPEPAPQSAPTPAPAPVAPSDTTQSSAEDIELEKRKQRAARFGIPLVEPHQKKTRPAAKSAAVAASIDPKVLEQRAARFGLNTQAPDAKANSNGKKRSAPTTQDVDPEELERRRKRAERFGTGNKA